jgi:molybdenum cofactor guanylyltransferase
MGTSAPAPSAVGGYVLAGGRSSRMGAEKALLELAGRPLIEHAVGKLRRVCTAVHILSSNPALAAYAPLVADIHPGCGPIGGMEAALHHSLCDWNLFLAVDMPFLPAAYIQGWLRVWMNDAEWGARIRMFTAGGRPQPGFCLLHKDLAQVLSNAIGRGEFKLMAALEAAGRELAARRGGPAAAGLWNSPTSGLPETPGDLPTTGCFAVSQAQRAAEHLWFANLNTPEDLALAEANLDALDP